MNRFGLLVLKASILILLGAIALTGVSWAGSFQGDFQAEIASAPSGSFVTGLVMMQEQLDRNTLEQQIAAQHLDTRWRRHQYVITTAQALAARTQASLLQTLEGLRRQGRVRSYESFWITNMVEVDALPEVFETLVSRPDLGTIFVNATLDARTGWDIPNGNPPPVDVLPDNLICVNVQHAWDLGYHGEGRLVALFDTGADGHHPALASRWRGMQLGVPWWEAWKDPSGNTSFPYDSGTHGTHVLGIMVAKKPDGTAIGVAPSAKWIAAGVLISGVAQQTIECYQWAADPDGDPSTIDDVPDVINNSWGVRVGCDQTYWNAIDIVEAAGIVNVIAVDDTGPGAMSVKSPESRATTPTVNFGVGDVNPHTPGYPIAQTSGRGPSPCDSVSIKPEVTAPGEVIYSTLPNNAYGNKSGTSMACPHTAGAAAILRQVNPDLTVDEIKTILMSTASDRGAHGEDNTYGWGIINIGAAVDYAYSTLPKYPPSNLGTASNANNVTLTWQRPGRIYFQHPVQKYRIYRAPVGQGYPVNPVAEVSDTSAVVSYHDNGLAWGDYQYVVTAFYQTGESGPSNSAAAHLALSAPQNLIAHVVGDSVGLNWQRPDPVFPAFPLQSYLVFRASVGDTFPPDPIAVIPDAGQAVTFVDTAPSLGTFHYSVTAQYQSGDRIPSNDVQVSITLDPPRNLTEAVNPGGTRMVHLSWERPEHSIAGQPVQSYRLFRAVVGGAYTADPFATIPDSLGVLAYDDTTSLAPGRYRYVATALYPAAESAHSNEVEADIDVPPPRNLTFAIGSDSVTLGWLRPLGIANTNPLQTYGVFRAAVGDSFPSSPLAEFADTSSVLSFVDRTVPSGRYQYEVVANYQVSSSPPSNVVYVSVNVTEGVKDLSPLATAPLRAAPNPFNPTTVIHYRPMNRALLRIAIWNLQGALVRDLVVSASPIQTDQSIAWDGRDEAGRRVASGMYFVRMTQGGRNATCRVTLIR